MGQNKLSDYYETLELTDDASWPEIRRSYLNLKELYSTPSIATQSLNEGMVTEWGEKIIKKIDEAYKGLEEYHKEIRQKNEKKIERIVSEINLFCGSSLKKIREELNIDLLDIAISSNIQIKHLENIEDENYGDLPNDVYLKGYLRSYAKYISLDSTTVVGNYMQRYQEWRQKATQD